MAVAYAAVVSLMHLLEQIQLYHARRPIFIDKQLRQLESLQEKVGFLQDFLESYSHGSCNEVEELKIQIANAAYSAEDIIESHVVDQILDGSTSHEEKSSLVSCQGLEKLIEDIDFMKKEVVKNTEKCKLRDHQPRDVAFVGSSGPPPLTPFTGRNTLVGFDDDSRQMMDKLTGQQPGLQIIPITGMGGIGKTTLAKNAYDHKSIVQHFDLRGWITVSQVYNEKDMLLGLLREMGHPTLESRHPTLESYEYHQLGEILHKHLSSRRYLIVMDDVWSIEAWDKLKLFFPNYSNRSRIMITTRLSKVAYNLDTSNLYKMNFMDEDKSWSLLCEKVFVKEDCPPEFEEVGKKIAKNCQGLPLSIVVIGGLLAKSKMTREYWEYIAENTSSTIHSEDDDRCLKVLSLSYNNLPIHLKPCFLYMGLFQEDDEIRISNLIKLWVAEGFLKPHRTKILEEVAEDYLKDLIERNLVFVSKFGCTGNMKFCKIHDLLRDLCLREAQIDGFLCATTMHSPDISQCINSERRIAIHDSMACENDRPHAAKVMESASFVRSLTCHFDCDFKPSDLTRTDFRLMRVLNVIIHYSPNIVSELVNSRYLNFGTRTPCEFPLFYSLWNLQTMILRGRGIHPRILPGSTPSSKIWEMRQLRHLVSQGIVLPDPPIDGKYDFVLENLQTLSRVKYFRCTEEILKRIPNIKKLNIHYPIGGPQDSSHYCFNNIGSLQKLQTLYCTAPYYRENEMLDNLEFPPSLKKLSLFSCYLNRWEDMIRKIGSLPHLEKLKLQYCHTGEEWNTIDGQFPSLKFLQINKCDNLVSWRADSSHFPSLEHLVISSMCRLEEIPSDIGYIATLRSIRLASCSHSVVASAKEILEEQQSFGNEDLCLVIAEEDKNEAE